MFENFPYSNFHDLNTDWIVKKIKDVETSEANAQASAESASTNASSAENSATGALASMRAAQTAENGAIQALDGSREALADARQVVAETANQVNLLQSRVNNIIPSGTQTEGNTELLDIRVGYNGVTYPSAGDAVRKQVRDLNNNIDTVNEITGAIDGFIGYNAILQTDGSEITVTKNDTYTFYGIGIKNKNITFTLNNVEYFPIAYGTSPNTQNYEFILTAVNTNNANFGTGYIFDYNVNTGQLSTDRAISTRLLNTNAVYSANPEIEFSHSGTNVTISYNGMESTIDISEIAVSTTMSGNFSVPMAGAILHPTTHGTSYVFTYKNVLNKIVNDLQTINTQLDGVNTRLVRVEELTRQRWSGKSWCAFGDSITAMGLYEPLVKNQLNFNSFENMGAGGSTIAELYAGQTAAFCNRYNTIASGFDVITILGGTNDFGQNIPLGTQGSTDKTTFYGGLSALLTGIKAKFPTTPILFFTPLQRDYFGTAEEISGMVNGNGNTLKEYRDIIIEMCANEGIPCFDLYSMSGLYPENVHTWTSDGLHPNQLFWNTHYQLIGDFINKYLPTN